MISINVDVDECIKDTQSFFRDQLPFAFSKALNDTIFDVRNHETNVVYPASFHVRNPAFPGRIWRVTQKATKALPVARLEQVADLDWITRQAEGGTKAPSHGGNLAIPVNEDMRRSGGAIAKAQKPLNLKRKFIRQVHGKKMIFQRVGRGKGEIKLKYVLQMSAHIAPRFPFFATAETRAAAVFSGFYEKALTAAVLTSRFVRG